MAIKKCVCIEKPGCEYQDIVYGKNMRVANKAGSKDQVKYRCTNCGKDIESGSDKKK